MLFSPQRPKPKRQRKRIANKGVVTMKNIKKYVRWAHALRKCKNFRQNRKNDVFYFDSKIFKAFLIEAREKHEQSPIYMWDNELQKKYDFIHCNAITILQRIRMGGAK